MNKLTLACMICMLVAASAMPGCTQTYPPKKIKCGISIDWNHAAEKYSYVLNFDGKVDSKKVYMKIFENETGVIETVFPDFILSNNTMRANSTTKPIANRHYILSVFVGTKLVGQRTIAAVSDFAPDINFTANYDSWSSKKEGNVSHVLEGETKYVQSGSRLEKMFVGTGKWDEDVVTSTMAKRTSLTQQAWKNITYVNGIEIANESCVFANGFMYSEMGGVRSNLSVANIGSSENGNWTYLWMDAKGKMDVQESNLSVNVTMTRDFITFASQRNTTGTIYDCIVVWDVTTMTGNISEGIGANVTLKPYYSQNATKKYLAASLAYENTTIYLEYNFTESQGNSTKNKTGTYFPKGAPTQKPLGIDDIASFRGTRPSLILPGDRVLIPSDARTGVIMLLECSNSTTRNVMISKGKSVNTAVDCIVVSGRIYDIGAKVPNAFDASVEQMVGVCNYTIASSECKGLLVESYESLSALGGWLERAQILRDIIL